MLSLIDSKAGGSRPDSSWPYVKKVPGQDTEQAQNVKKSQFQALTQPGEVYIRKGT